MRLFHGTNIDFSAIDLSKSSPFKDFGKGFYLTDIEEQAVALAAKKSKIFGGSPVIQVYEIDDAVLHDGTLNTLVFDSPSREWAEFIFNNRNRTGSFSHNYDVVYGPIANDGVAYLLGRYDEGTITLEELAKELEFRKLNNQYFFGTEKAISFLQRI